MTDTLSQQWLNRAEEDLAVARLVLDEEYPAHACFLSQQCVEKALKAFLLATINSYPRTHKVVDLLGECQRVEPEFNRFLSDALVIDQYYIPTRYPDGIPGGTSGGLPDFTEAKEAVSIAEELFGFVKSQTS